MTLLQIRGSRKGDTDMKVYEKTWFIILMLVIFFPVGLFLMWKYSGWNKVVKIVITVIFALGLIMTVFGSSEEDPKQEDNKQAIQQEQIEEEITEPTEKEEEVDKKKELKEKYDIGSAGTKVPNDVTNSWTELFISSAEANDPTLWAYDYVNEYWEKGVKVMWVINYANNTTTSINVTEDGADGMLIVTQRDAVKDEHKDAKVLGSGDVLAEWIIYHDDNGKLVIERTDE